MRMYASAAALSCEMVSLQIKLNPVWHPTCLDLLVHLLDGRELIRMYEIQGGGIDKFARLISCILM